MLLFLSGRTWVHQHPITSASRAHLDPTNQSRLPRLPFPRVVPCLLYVSQWNFSPKLFAEMIKRIPIICLQEPQWFTFLTKFCSSSVHEFSLMKYIEVSSPKTNKKDVEIIRSTVVKVFFNNLNLRRSNYFTHFFFIFQTHMLNHTNQKISHHQGTIKRPSCVHPNVLCRLLLWFQRELRKTFLEWMTFLPDMWIFRYSKKHLREWFKHTDSSKGCWIFLGKWSVMGLLNIPPETLPAFQSLREEIKTTSHTHSES